MKSEPILREAETKDMKSIIFLVGNLIDHEVNIADIPVIEDLPERKRIVMEMVARALIDPDQNAWVVEKSGRILGIFIAVKEDRDTIEARNPMCVFTHAYNQKTVLPFHEIHNRVRTWAREKSCKGIQMTALSGNDKIQNLVKSLGYYETARTYEMEV